ncbi:hypothetical protein QBC38DRAFT_184261 [Podospora fimiseda]|uniref:Uncharacterized protein n=1 Tax=Podospora fimiseda TaxID=252190 RepID=A0AAN7BEQ5_9PEZI|nr:hypothetical protein QBC38DRAFT_184261 [Podospora fimiseda]
MPRNGQERRQPASRFPHRNRNRNAKSADYYKQLAKAAKATAPRAVNAETTKQNMSNITKRWSEYCKFLKVNPQVYLEGARSEEVMVFFRWLLDERSTIKKRSTLNEYKRMWMMIYRKSTGRDFPRQEAEHLQNYIMQLSINKNLDILDKEKLVLNADDMYLILHHHWVRDQSIFPHERQRLQLALMLLVQAYTATRPRVISYRPTNPSLISAHYIGQDPDSDSELESGVQKHLPKCIRQSHIEM